MPGRWSISERGRSNNSGRRSQWEPGVVSRRCAVEFNGSRGRHRGGGASASAAAAATATAAFNGSRGRHKGGGASASAAAVATAAAAFNGSRGWCRGGGASASAAAAATAAGAFNGSRGWCRGGGASASAAAAPIAAAAFNGSWGRGRGGGDKATAAVTAAGAGTVGGDRRSDCGDFGDGPVDTGSRRARRRWNHSRWGVWSGNGGGDIHEGAAGASGGAVVFARTATAAAVPCETGSHEIESTATGSIKDVYVSCGGGGYRTLAQPDAALCDSEELPAGPAHLLETPETYEQAHAGPHDRI